MPDTTSAVKDMEDSKEICRTCLQNICDGDADVHMLNSVAFPTPERTYVDILTDLGKLKVAQRQMLSIPSVSNFLFSSL